MPGFSDEPQYELKEGVPGLYLFSNPAESALEKLWAQWGEHFPLVTKSWPTKWPMVLAHFEYPDRFRDAVYITNPFEAIHLES